MCHRFINDIKINICQKCKYKYSNLFKGVNPVVYNILSTGTLESQTAMRYIRASTFNGSGHIF